MVAFSSPPRDPNQWFMEEPAVALVLRPVSRRRRLAIPIGVSALLASAIALIAQIPDNRPTVPVEFAKTREASTAERLLRKQIGPTPSLRMVRATMTGAQLFCRETEGRGRDSLLVCLGEAVRFEAAYTRMAFRFVSVGDSVTRVVVCPALIATQRKALPEVLRAHSRPTLTDASCWRDPANPAHTEWAWAALPDPGRFTTVPEPDAPRMRAESAPTADTVLVIW